MPVGLDEEICPHCRAPRDDMEMEEGRALVREHERRLKRRPKLIAAGFAIVLLLCLVWFARARIADACATAWRDFAAEIEKTRDPSRYAAAQPSSLAISGSSAGPAKLPDEPAISSFVYLGGAGSQTMAMTVSEPVIAGGTPESRAQTAVAPAPALTATAAPVPPHPGGQTRRFYGVIYDIDSLKPIGGAKIRFAPKSSDHGWTAISDDQGRYQIDFSNGVDSGLFVSAEVPGYSPGLLEDKDPPLLERTREARLAIMSELTEGDLDPIPLRFRESADLVEFNLIVVPKAVK